MICEHGQLKRSCEICEKDAEIAALSKQVEELNDECDFTGDAIKNCTNGYLYCVTQAAKQAEVISALRKQVEELKVENKRITSELRKWERLPDSETLSEIAKQAEQPSLAARQVYINGLKHYTAHLRQQALAGQKAVEAMEKYRMFFESCSCLFAEGVEFFSKSEIYESIKGAVKKLEATCRK